MTVRNSARAARGAATTTRLISAAVAILRDEGTAGVSVQRVADVAGTSKGLVHYHFADKDSLLTACARRVTEQLIDEESAALTSSTAASALDDLWSALSTPEHRGLRRALLALATAATPGMRLGMAESTAQRQRAAARTVGALCQLLHLEVTVSRSALSMLFLAVMDGLGLEGIGQEGLAQHRHAYDAFWLAVLSLAA